ncbi:MAG: UDP-N-acetylmuramoyl-tripeptide--D-alanyl-D-alanine ligase [Proteobacteria bacterium]|nr:UDP-N-acetylmuramoyl-tripeptide--D-alanyl-D-alanine ligase [Pseudomonadota bacterium]HQR04371.1 UDP-N-acetylmuramoyl-tripeptide--D-alanyl-D-alanine ligase [Rhodocyclaceae bacterium]
MLNLYTAARGIGARATGEDVRFSGVSSDSRGIVPGDLFVALRGENFDGHDFVHEVLARGAAAALVDERWAAAQHATLPLIVADDTRLALGRLAAFWRNHFDIPLLGITGSNGKTTVKEMCAAILADRFGEGAVLATQGNFNNEIGLPLTLLKLRSWHRAAVIEMGMNHTGEIAYLTGLAHPTVAVVNNAQRAHLEGLGSVTAVARAKGEIFSGLTPGGVAVINADDPQCELWQALNADRIVLRFGLAASTDVTARVTAEPLASHIELHTPAGDASFILPVPGAHNVSNALAATAACLAAEVSLEHVVAALSRYGGVQGRLQRKPGLYGAQIIDDSYNANPDSMRAAVDVLAAQPGRRILVVGDMGEVGEAGAQFHDELGGYAKSMGIERLLCLGDLSMGAARGFGAGATHYPRLEALLAALTGELDAQTTVLVKGSRFMRMERVVNAIADKGESNAS